MLRQTLISSGRIMSKALVPVAPKKHPGGRPTKYKKEYCQDLIDFMSQGYSFEAFAGKILVAKDTLNEWCDVHPEFSAAKRLARESCRMFWEKIALDHIVSKSIVGVGAQSLNSSVWMFNMKNRFGWTDRITVDAAQSNQKPIALAYTMDDE
jgi:hypothetical protein